MQLDVQELGRLMSQFEDDFKGLTQLDREQDMVWREKGYAYQCSETNKLFRAYRAGYLYAKQAHQQKAPDDATTDRYQLQINQAAKGCISGTLDDWPLLRQALKRQGVYLPGNTSAARLQRLCKKLSPVPAQPHLIKGAENVNPV